MATTNTSNDGAQLRTPGSVYRGRRTSDATPNPVTDPDGNHLDPRTDLAEHSPTGFEWGYGGSGPAQLALALLADRYDDAVALDHYQRFKSDVIARLDGDKWTLNAGVVEDYLTTKQVATSTPSTEISGPHAEVIEGEETGATFYRCEGCGMEALSAALKHHGCPRCDE